MAGDKWRLFLKHEQCRNRGWHSPERLLIASLRSLFAATQAKSDRREAMSGLSGQYCDVLPHTLYRPIGTAMDELLQVGIIRLVHLANRSGPANLAGVQHGDVIGDGADR
jgi:hypothetical protein